MLLDLPPHILHQTLSFSLPDDWGRARIAHCGLSFPNDQLLQDAGVLLASPLPRLSDAARDGHLLAVLAQLQRGADPNERDKQHPKYTPLHRATSGGHRVVLRLLLASRAGVNVRDRLGFCALHFAANQSVEMVSDLLAASCEANATNLQGLSPLHSAAGMGRGDVCEVLLSAGARAIASASGVRPADLARRAAVRRIGSQQNDCLRLADRLAALEETQQAESQSEEGLRWCFDASPSGGVQGTSEWTPVEDATAAILDAAFKRGEDSVVFSSAGRTYHIDFGQLIQRNTQTGTTRRVSRQRVAPSMVESSPPGFWVPAAPGHWDGLVSTGAPHRALGSAVSA